MTPQDSMQSLAASNARNVEAMQSLANASLKAAERLMALNLDYARASMDTSANYARPVASGDWQEVVTQNRSAVQQATETTAAWFRSIYDVSAETQAEFAELVSSRVEEASESMTSMLGKLAQSGPAGSENAAAMFKSFMASSRSAYDQFINSTKQMTAAGLAVAGQSRQSASEVSVAATRAEKKKAA